MLSVFNNMTLPWGSGGQSGAMTTVCVVSGASLALGFSLSNSWLLVGTFFIHKEYLGSHFFISRIFL